MQSTISIILVYFTNAVDWINLTNLFSVNDDNKRETYYISIRTVNCLFASLREKNFLIQF